VDLDEEYAARHPSAKAGHYVQFAVSDNGCGMDKKYTGADVRSVLHPHRRRLMARRCVQNSVVRETILPRELVAREQSDERHGRGR
jgi:hypothetical protein